MVSTLASLVVIFFLGMMYSFQMLGGLGTSGPYLWMKAFG